MSLSPSPSTGATREAEAVKFRTVDGAEARELLDGLAALLEDCVAGGASVSYMAPFSRQQARDAFEGMVTEVEQGRRLLLCAFAGADLIGTVQLIIALPPKQPHRGEIAKLLVRRDARRRGIARRLMEHAETAARAAGKTLLLLDTVTGADGERLYLRLGWTKVGVVPGFALFPDRRPCNTTYFFKSIQR
jgi:GNAT superfamily N-acetyltransferase